MGNRDFRNRLKNHTSEPSQNAWDQMDQMLDALPEKKEKKKRPFILFWIFGGLGILAVLGYVMKEQFFIDDKSRYSTIGTTIDSDTETAEPYSLDQRESKNVESSSIVKEEPAKSATSQNSDLSVSIDSVNKTQLKRLQNREENQLQSKDTKLVSNSRSDDNQSQSRTDEVSISQYSDKPNFQSNESRIVSSEAGEIAHNKFIENEEESSSSSSIGIADESNWNLEKDPNEKADEKKASENDVEILAAREDISQLDFITPKLSLISLSGIRLFDSPMVEIIKPSKFTYGFGGGYAKFNDNNGFFLHGDVRYVIDEILEAEGSLSYSYGRDKNARVGNEFEYENQIDLSLILYLNFINLEKHKFSFFAGIGITKYAGQRVINIPQEFNIRSSFGTSFRLGLRYEYHWDKDITVGMRVGAISYDDAVIFFSPFVTKKF